MKLLALSALVAAVAAYPQSTANELQEGKCGDVVFIMARASTEPGNMGGSMGPIVCKGLKKDYPNKVVCQGVGSPYSAGLGDNARPGGTSPEAIKKAQSLFQLAVSKCPQATIVFGGYSQGTAVMHNAVKGLSPDIKTHIAGGVLFGDTRNTQDKGQVPDFPKDKVHIYCDSGDGVCKGTLAVTAGHFAYMGNGDGPKAIAFLKGKIDAHKSGGGSAGAAASAGSSAPAEAPAAPKGKLGKGGKGAAPAAAPAVAPAAAPAAEPEAEARSVLTQ